MLVTAISAAALLLAQQGLPGFQAGEVIEEFGPVAPQDATFEPREGQAFRVVWDVAKTVDEGENRDISKIARFINMHGEGGLDPRPLDLVLVIHGRAVGDVTDEERNGQKALVEALLDEGVRIIVCGQSMTALGVDPDDLLPGVDVALSAMTAHASLGAEGYTSMPF